MLPPIEARVYISILSYVIGGLLLYNYCGTNVVFVTGELVHVESFQDYGASLLAVRKVLGVAG